jgi:hypothetical protein
MNKILSPPYKLTNLLPPHLKLYNSSSFINLPNKFNYPLTFSTSFLCSYSVTFLNFVHSLSTNMTISVVPKVKDECLMVRGNLILTNVPQNIVVSPVSAGSAFLGATSPIPSSRHVFTLGTLR